MVKSLFGRTGGSEEIVVTSTDGCAEGIVECDVNCGGGSGAAVGGGANKKRFILANAANSFSSLSLSDFMSLKRFLLLNRDPFSNMSRAAGCSAQ